MSISISFAITTHNECVQLKKSIDLIENNLDDGDELIILDDYSSNTDTLEILKNKKVFKKEFVKDYAEHKNYLNKLCRCEYIFQLDGDEVLSNNLIVNIKNIITDNKEIDLFYIPRANYVHGITKYYLKMWNWSMDGKRRVNYPDYQGRLYKNEKRLYWHRQVHERIKGNLNFTKLPLNKNLDIIHEKNIQKQKANNKFYTENYDNDCIRKK